MKKVGIIRCRQTEELCPGTTDFKCAKAGTLAFEPFGPCEIVGFVSCGGCPGKSAVARAKMLASRGAEAVFLASCIKKGSPIDMSCPNYASMKAAVEKALGDIPLIDWTH